MNKMLHGIVFFLIFASSKNDTCSKCALLAFELHYQTCCGCVFYLPTTVLIFFFFRHHNDDSIYKGI